MGDFSADAAVLAADCNLRREEDKAAWQLHGLSEDAWVLAGNRIIQRITGGHGPGQPKAALAVLRACPRNASTAFTC